jgi:hypothetical protein
MAGHPGADEQLDVDRRKFQGTPSCRPCAHSRAQSVPTVEVQSVAMHGQQFQSRRVRHWRIADLATLAGVALRVWTAAEFEQLSPAEQDAIFAAAIVRDLAEVPPAFLARVRARFEDHIGGTEPRAQ